MALNEGATQEALAIRALWATPRQAWIALQWDKLKSNLLEVCEDWEVWVDWYEARLRGETANQALEVARVMISEKIWQQGPKILNIEIKRLMYLHK